MTKTEKKNPGTKTERAIKEVLRMFKENYRQVRYLTVYRADKNDFEVRFYKEEISPGDEICVFSLKSIIKKRYPRKKAKAKKGKK